MVASVPVDTSPKGMHIITITSLLVLKWVHQIRVYQHGTSTLGIQDISGAVRANRYPRF